MDGVEKKSSSTFIDYQCINNCFGCGEKAKPFRRNHVTYKKLFRATCHQNLAPIVAAARCFVSGLEMQRLQRIAGR